MDLKDVSFSLGFPGLGLQVLGILQVLPLLGFPGLRMGLGSPSLDFGLASPGLGSTGLCFSLETPGLDLGLVSHLGLNSIIDTLIKPLCQLTASALSAKV